MQSYLIINCITCLVSGHKWPVQLISTPKFVHRHRPPLLRNSPQSRRRTMAGMLNFTPAPLFRPVPTRRARNDRVFMVKSSANTSETPLSSISPPPNFKAPQPKPFAVRPDRVLDILGASLALLFRLTTSVLVSGYLISYSTFISNCCYCYMFLCIISCSLFVLILHLNRKERAWDVTLKPD